ncbi:MAG: efflux RND transporter periplasmic adaptor subunit [Synergistaceae bacterium]|jgi:RND family efflux transporter MFP subunit|nr:efflux RND transporter periplasmic adaptor subunit [Synergistaceae bacterium]
MGTENMTNDSMAGDNMENKNPENENLETMKIEITEAGDAGTGNAGANPLTGVRRIEAPDAADHEAGDQESGRERIESPRLAGPGPDIERLRPKKRRKRNRAGALVALVTIAVVAYFANLLLNGQSAPPSMGAQTGEQPAPSVVLNVVASVDLATEHEYIGRVESIQSVQLRPQISGQIAEVHFKEGSTVKAGQLLFTIDARQYQATVDLRKADLDRAEAGYDRARKYYERLKATDSRSVPASDLDTAQSDVLQGKASVDQAKAALRLAQIDLGYTKIAAPIAGRIGGALFTKGNLVSPAGGPLAHIVQIDPVRVAFALPDRDYLDALVAFESPENVYRATVRLSNGEEYPVTGARDFEENIMDERTGTMMVHLRFQNAEGLLVPGAMVRVTTRPVDSHVAIVIPQESVLSDAQGDYIYVVDAGNVTHQRRVTLGAEEGALREVASGLSTGERIVVYGLQSIRPEMKVTPLASAGAPAGGAGLSPTAVSSTVTSSSGSSSERKN